MNADVAAEDTSALALWNDPTAAVAARVDALIAAMTLEEKTAQLFGVWVGASADGGEVARTSTRWRTPSTSTRSSPPGWAS